MEVCYYIVYTVPKEITFVFSFSFILQWTLIQGKDMFLESVKIVCHNFSFFLKYLKVYKILIVAYI